MVAYIRGLFSWLFDGCEVMERLGRHRASLAKPYLVMAALKSVLDCLPTPAVSPNPPVFSINPCPKYGCDESASTSSDGRADNPRSRRLAIMVRTAAVHLLSACTIMRRVFSMHLRRILRNDMIESSL